MRRLVRWFPLAWASVAYVVLTWIPTYGQVSDSASSDGVELHTVGHATLAAVNGPRIYLILAIPVLAAALTAAPWPPALRRPAAVGGAVISGAFALIGLMSIGVFFLPSTLALIALAQTTSSTTGLAT